MVCGGLWWSVVICGGLWWSVVFRLTPMLLVLFCIHVNHLCTLYLYSFLAVVYRGPHGRLAFFFAKCVTL